MLHVHRLMDAAVRDNVFPGGVLYVSRGEETIVERAYGRANRFSNTPVTVDTVFDLASLTKPLATAMAMMALVQSGRLSLDTPLGSILPQFAGSAKAAIKIEQLLNHSSGLPPWRPYFAAMQYMDHAQARRKGRELLMQEPLLQAPGQVQDYSDLGYMILHWIMETVTGSPLDQFVQAAVYAPLGLEGLFFNPLNAPRARPERCAATQLCPWRRRLLVGQVDDDNAWAVGGVDGHAGLFGSARAVAALLQALLCTDQEKRGQGCLDPPLVRQFLHAQDTVRWALGFDTPAAVGSSAGRHFSKASVGHLGFTGTSFWVDRSKRIIIVLLTNRVHPFRFAAGIRSFRPRLHDAVMEGLGAV